MDGRTDGRTEFLPILQDFVPCWGRCPATLCDFSTSKRQGKRTADLMMPFGVLLFNKGPAFRAHVFEGKLVNYLFGQ